MNSHFELMRMLAPLNLRPAELTGVALRRTKGPFDHTGLLMGLDSAGGWMVLYHAPNRGTELLPLEVFAQGDRIYMQTGLPERPDVIVGRAIKIWKEHHSYHPVFFNCQHFTNLAVTGKKFSNDLQAWTAAGFLISGLLLVNRE